MRFGSLILKNLVRRPLRSALTLLALATAIAAVVALLGIARGFTRSFADIYAAHSVDIVVSRQGSADRLSSSVDQGYAGKIASLPEVDRAAAVLLETLSLEEEGIYGIPSMGIDRDSWLLDDYKISTQNDITSNQNDTIGDRPMPHPRSLMLGVQLADNLGVGAGGSVNLFDEEYAVTGIFQSPSTWENGSMILPLEQLQRLTDRAGQVTYINVVLKVPSAQMSTTTIEKIEMLDPKLLALATVDFVRTDTRMRLANAMAWMTSVVALVLGSIGTLNTMLTSVMERTVEIGVLRAIGWPKRRVVTMILLESCGLAALASIVGVMLAAILTWTLAQAPAARGILSPTIDAAIIGQGFLLAVGMGLLGAMLPAWRAAKLLPTEAFREH